MEMRRIYLLAVPLKRVRPTDAFMLFSNID